MMSERSLPLSPRKALAFVNGFRAIMLLVLLFMSMLQGSEGQRLVDGGGHFNIWAVVYGCLIASWFALRDGKMPIPCSCRWPLPPTS
jgi:two-component system sensor histidine kinase PilS (NtrC family)